MRKETASRKVEFLQPVRRPLLRTALAASLLLGIPTTVAERLPTQGSRDGSAVLIQEEEVLLGERKGKKNHLKPQGLLFKK